MEAKVMQHNNLTRMGNQIATFFESMPQKFDTNFRKTEFPLPLSPINSSTYGGFGSLDKKCV